MRIAITGNPGVGKHTVANEIIKNMNFKLLDINKIAKDSGLFEKNDGTNDVDVEELEKLISTTIEEHTLIVGHLAPYVIPFDKVDKVIVLRRSPYDLLRIYEERRYTKEKAKENAGSEALGIIAYDSAKKFKEKVFQINTSQKEIREVTKIVLNIISGMNDSEEIEWLEAIKKNNDLEKFFAY